MSFGTITTKRPKKFRWATMTGEKLTLSQMDTGHMFHAMKMLFNHLANEYNIPVVDDYTRYGEYQEAAKKSPERMFDQMEFFLEEIHNRQDLNLKYLRKFNRILELKIHLETAIAFKTVRPV